jgi:uncharacterized protein
VRVLITGASGLIGSALSDALLARGDEVVGLSRDPEKARPRNPTVSWYRWQPAVERPPAEAFDHVDAVVNVIGEEINQRLSEPNKRRIRESRVTASRNLIQGIKARDQMPKVFIGQSAISYYGDRGAAIVDEESERGDERFITQVVVDWEAAEHEAGELGMRLVIFRTAPILAKNSGLINQLRLPFKLGLGGPIAGGEQYLSWINLDDEVALILWALDNEAVSGVINASAPNPVTNREFSKALGRALNRPAVIPVPKLAVTAMRGRELADAVAGGARVIPRRALDLGFDFRHSEIDEALRSALR